MSEMQFELETLQIATPCSADWNAMEGNDRLRFCGSCQLNVYNLSGMSRVEATELVAAQEGRVCIRMFRRADGTVITRDCPVGLRALRMRLVRGVAALVALVVALFGGTSLAAGKPSLGPGPMSTLSEWLMSTQTIEMGGCMPPPALPGAQTPAPAPTPTTLDVAGDE